jgi:hypothetical protein
VGIIPVQGLVLRYAEKSLSIMEEKFGHNRISHPMLEAPSFSQFPPVAKSSDYATELQILLAEDH